MANGTAWLIDESYNANPAAVRAALATLSGIETGPRGRRIAVLMYGLFAAISVQKSVRDRLEGIPVTNLYYGISWVSVLLTVVLLAVGLWNATLTLSEKGFYAMAFVLSLFAAIAVQKNTRDGLRAGQSEPADLGQ